jgi:hypothetical protein
VLVTVCVLGTPCFTATCTAVPVFDPPPVCVYVPAKRLPTVVLPGDPPPPLVAVLLALAVKPLRMWVLDADPVARIIKTEI